MDASMSRRDAVRALGVAAGGVAAGGVAAARNTAAYNAVPPAVPDLTGKTLVVKTASRPIEMPLILSGCSFETQSGRLFLSGTNVPHAPDAYNWTDGIRRLVAWDVVEEYMVFDSVEHYYSRLVLPVGGEGPDNLPT